MRISERRLPRALALALPLASALLAGCAPATTSDVSARREALAAPAGDHAVAADAGCEPLQLHDARFQVTTTRRYEELDPFGPEGPNCVPTIRAETSVTRYHLFWQDNGHYFAPLGQEVDNAIALNMSSTPAEFTFSAQLSPFEGAQNVCPEYAGLQGFYAVTGTLEGRIDRATGELSFTRRCQAEGGFSCGGDELYRLEESARGTHACEPSNADPLPVPCAPLVAGDLLGAARLHVIGTHLDMDDVPLDCSIKYTYSDLDSTFTLREEGGQYFANLFALGRESSIPLTKTSQTATEIAFAAAESGDHTHYDLRNICPEYYHQVPLGPGLGGSVKLRVDLSTGAVSYSRYCSLNFAACGSDSAFSENGQGAFVCPP
jgi:hypothetical protein